jgi:cytochrome c oxidase cbb3-type subunit 3
MFHQVKVRGQKANGFLGTARLIQVAVALTCSLTGSHAQTAVHNVGKPKQSNQTLAPGRRTFESSCAPCHGLNGKGGEHAPDIATKPDIAKLSDSETLKVVREGKSQAGMPPFAGLGSAKLSAILNYLRFLQGERKAPSERQAPSMTVGAEQGKELFSGKGGCSECHMVHGMGGFLGPDLSDYGANHPAEDIRSAIVNADKRPGVRKGIARATSRDGKQISGLVRNEDNLSLQLQALDGTFYSLEKASLSELVFDAEPLMPDNYGAKLSKLELDQLVGYLLSIVDTNRNGQAVTKK